MKSDIVFGCITGYGFAEVEVWVNSLLRSGFQGKKVMIVYNCSFATTRRLTSLGFDVFGLQRDEAREQFVFPKPLLITARRFYEMWAFLDSLDVNKYRYVISADVKDVVFQRNPSDWLEANMGDKAINVSSECLALRNEPWGAHNMVETFGQDMFDYMSQRTVYNAGTIAGEARTMRDLFLNVFLVAAGGKSSIPDQAALNILLTLDPYRAITRFSKAEDGWACQAGSLADPTKIAAFRPHLLEPEPVFVDGVVKTHGGADFVLVHQYDRVPEWKEAFERRFRGPG